VMFAASLLMVIVVMGGVYWFQPELLGFAPGPPQARTDSLSARPTARPTTLPLYGPTLAELRGKDPLNLLRDTVSILRDSLQVLEHRLAAERTRVDTVERMNVNPVAKVDSSAPPPVRETKDRKAMTRMLEVMAAENVAKLLKGMSDEEVKELLLSLKTKQAAKILAALDPDRAAKLIR